jgi:hypothetical protein
MDYWGIPSLVIGLVLVRLSMIEYSTMLSQSRKRLSRFLERILAKVKAHPVWLTLIVAVLVIIAANLVLTEILHTHLNVGSELGLELLILLVVISVQGVLVSAVLWPELRVIYKILFDSPAKATPILVRFVKEEIKELGEKISQTLSDGTDLQPNEVTPWIRNRCFAVASGNYLTTDVLVPSEFMDIYPDYLQTHRQYLQERSCDSVRINLASTGDLLADSESNPDAFNKYEQWHADAGVKLLHLDLARAKKIAEQCQLGKAIDFAIWQEEFAIVVEYRDSGKTNLRLTLVNEPIYRRCMSFFERVQDEAISFSETRDSDSDLVSA